MDARALWLAIAVPGALALLAPGAGAAEVTTPRLCYAEGESIGLSATGFVPGTPASVVLARGIATLRSADDAVADASGRVSGRFRVDDRTGWFADLDEWRFRMTLRVTDRFRPQTSARTRFWFSRWQVAVRARGGRLRADRPALVVARGFAGDAGRPLYAHFTRPGVRRRSVRLGRLRAPCGTLRARLDRGLPRTPRSARGRGGWRVAFNASPDDPRAPRTIGLRPTP